MEKWLASDGQPLLEAAAGTQDIAINIGGHVLTRGIVARKVAVTKGGIVTITW